jgi:hypothetical protein
MYSCEVLHLPKYNGLETTCMFTRTISRTGAVCRNACVEVPLCARGAHLGNVARFPIPMIIVECRAQQHDRT